MGSFSALAALLFLAPASAKTRSQPDPVETLAPIIKHAEEERDRLEPIVNRLITSPRRLGWMDAEKLSAYDSERTVLRHKLKAGFESFHEEMQRLEEVKRVLAARSLERLTGGLRPENASNLAELARINKIGRELWDFDGRMRAVLYHENVQYQRRKDELDAERAERLRRYRLMMHASGAVFFLAGIALWLRWRHWKDW